MRPRRRTPAAASCRRRWRWPSASGRNGTALLRAVALGYDVGCRLTMSLDAYEFRDGRPFDAQLRPDVRRRGGRRRARRPGRRARRAHLLSYAAQQASGVSCWMRDEEHIEKAFDFGGMPARNGVAAATMVAHGFTGVEDVFSGERNFFVAYGRAPDARRARCANSARPTRS